MIVVLAVVAAAAEFAVRWYAGREIADEFRAQATAENPGFTPDDPKVSFGLHPVIAAAVTRTVGHVEVDTPSTLMVRGDDISGQPGSHLVLTDLDISDQNNPVAGTLEATSTLSNEFLLATVRHTINAQAAQEAGGGFGAQLLRSLVQVTDVRSDAAADTLVVEFSGGAASATLTPAPSGDAITFAVTKTEVLGLELPEEVTRQLTQALQEGISQQLARFGGLAITQATATEEGLTASVRGENVALRDLEASRVAN
nr:LmeA family phospholipid-binding protein [Corynebacterium sp. c6VSa_13]